MSPSFPENPQNLKFESSFKGTVFKDRGEISRFFPIYKNIPQFLEDSYSLYLVNSQFSPGVNPPLKDLTTLGNIQKL